MMKREWLVERLTEAVTTEEVDVLSNLNDLEEAILSSGLEVPVKESLLQGVWRLRDDSVRHAKAFAGMLQEAVKG